MAADKIQTTPATESHIEDLTRPATRHYGGKRLPIVAVLRGFGSQENTYEQGDVMCAAAELLTLLHGLAEKCPEINPSNYDHDEVIALNNAMIEIWTILNMATQA